MKAITTTEIQFPFGLVPATVYEDITPQGAYINVVVDSSKMDDAEQEQIIRSLAGTDQSGVSYFLKQAALDLKKDPSSGWFDMAADARERKVTQVAKDMYEKASNLRSFRPVAVLSTTTGEFVTYSRKKSTSDTYLRQLGHDAFIFTVSTSEGNALSIEEAKAAAVAAMNVTAPATAIA